MCGKYYSLIYHYIRFQCDIFVCYYDFQYDAKFSVWFSGLFSVAYSCVNIYIEVLGTIDKLNSCKMMDRTVYKALHRQVLGYQTLIRTTLESVRHTLMIEIIYAIMLSPFTPLAPVQWLVVQHNTTITRKNKYDDRYEDYIL